MQHAALDVDPPRVGADGGFPGRTFGTSLDSVGVAPSEGTGRSLSEPSVRDGGATPAVDGGELALDQSATDEQAHDSPLDAGVSKSEGACGDGQLDPREDCDWLPGVGARCVEFGYTTGQVTCSSACRYDFSACGGVETCFDGDDNDGDGLVDCDDADCHEDCSDSCSQVLQVDDPSSFPGDNSGRPMHLRSACIPGNPGPAMVYRVEVESSGMLDASVVSEGFPELTVSVRRDCADDTSELACGSAKVSTPATAGETLHVVVFGASAFDQGQYHLTLESRPANVCGDNAWDPAEQCDDPNLQDGDGCDSNCMVESSEGSTTGLLDELGELAGGLFGGGDELLGDLLELDVIGDEPYFGLIEPAGDVDRVVVEVPEDSAYAIINVYSLVAGGCEAAQFDPELTLLSADLATEIARNDDHNGSCPRLVSDALAAGLYVVEVRESVDSVAQRHEFPYELAVTVDWCGNGEWGPREECDDGNTESGDGCSSTCRVE